MTCSFRQCDPLQRGGCPCAEVIRCGGPMTSDQIAESMGVTGRSVRSILAGVVAKIKRLPAHKRRVWERLWAEHWPAIRAESMVAKAQDVPSVAFDPRPMYKHMVRKFKELGWSSGPRNPWPFPDE